MIRCRSNYGVGSDGLWCPGGMTVLQNLAQAEAKSQSAGDGAQPRAALQQSWQVPRLKEFRHCVGSPSCGAMLELVLARPAIDAS